MEVYPNTITVLNSDNQEQSITLISLLSQTQDQIRKVWLISTDQSNSTKQYSALKGIKRSHLSVIDVEFIQNEKKSLIELNHNGIVKLIETLKDQEYLYLNLELIRGITITQTLMSNQILNHKFIALIVAQLVLIIEYIHGQGFIYRDIKSSNIIINQNGRIKLIDMGETKKILIDGKVIKQNIFCGTNHMMAPEFYDESYKNGYSFEVDYYSLGCLIYEMAVGKAPFGYHYENHNLEQEIQQGLQQQHLDKIGEPNLVDLVYKLMIKNPQQRLQNIDQIKDHVFFKDLVDWIDMQKFIQIDLNKVSEEEQEIMEFYDECYSINKYSDDIEMIEHFQFNCIAEQKVEDQDYQKLNTFMI